MSEILLPGAAAPVEAGPGDFAQLLKPRVMSLVIFTALVGMAAAIAALGPGASVDLRLAGISLFAIALGAGASGALNMWWDSDIDAVMARTKDRPIPRGAVDRSGALAFGVILSVFAVTLLWLASNVFAAALLAFTIFFYVVVYSMWLKRRTPQNIVIGGLAGALPPVVGWAAIAGAAPVDAWILCAIIFLWTPPHFWALALFRSEDYTRAGVPMLPVVRGEAETRRQILLYAVIVALAGMAPLATGLGGLVYGATAILLGLWFVLLAWRVFRNDARNRGPEKRLFGFSILYLFALFAALLGESLWSIYASA